MCWRIRTSCKLKQNNDLDNWKHTVELPLESLMSLPLERLPQTNEIELVRHDLIFGKQIAITEISKLIKDIIVNPEIINITQNCAKVSGTGLEQDMRGRAEWILAAQLVAWGVVQETYTCGDLEKLVELSRNSGPVPTCNYELIVNPENHRGQLVNFKMGLTFCEELGAYFTKGGAMEHLEFYMDYFLVEGAAISSFAEAPVFAMKEVYGWLDGLHGLSQGLG